MRATGLAVLVLAMAAPAFGGDFQYPQATPRTVDDLTQVLARADAAGQLADLAVCTSEGCRWRVAGLTCDVKAAVEGGLRIETQGATPADNVAMMDLMVAHNLALYRAGRVDPAWGCRES